MILHKSLLKKKRDIPDRQFLELSTLPAATSGGLQVTPVVDCKRRPRVRLGLGLGPGGGRNEHKARSIFVGSRIFAHRSSNNRAKDNRYTTS